MIKTSKALIIFSIVSLGIICIGVLAYLAASFDLPDDRKGNVAVSNFYDCVDAGQPVMESYPRQCSYGGQTYVEDIGNAIAKSDLVLASNPQPGDVIVSPLVITGEARGYWFFEATFPVELTDSFGNKIAEGYATADDEWMTEEFVPFTAELTFTIPAGVSEGILILHKDNPSGLPENDDALEIPIRF